MTWRYPVLVHVLILNLIHQSGFFRLFVSPTGVQPKIMFLFNLFYLLTEKYNEMQLPAFLLDLSLKAMTPLPASKHQTKIKLNICLLFNSKQMFKYPKY